jgi:hypothetical protein
MPHAFLFALAPLVVCVQGDRAAAWTEDALHFVSELERLHPNPWFGCTQEDFEQAVDAYLGSLETASDNQALVGFLTLLARPTLAGRDGHSVAWPMAAHYLPLQLYGFADGWFVVGASDAQAERVGVKVLAIEGVPVDEVCARLAPLLTRDNEWNLREKLALALVCTELLDGVGLAKGPSVRVTLERAGKSEELALHGESASPHVLFGRPPLPARGSAAWLEGHEQAYRLRVLEPERALYVQFNEVRAQAADGTTLAAFAREMVRTFEERGLTKLIVDLRCNGGGDNTTFGPLIAALQTPSIDRPGVLFGLIGRGVFSAAGNFVTVLERDTKAILVGEPTGGAPNQYGDAEDVLLPNHRDLLVRVSTRYHQFGKPDDPRTTHEPHLRVPLRAADYFEGRDPVLEAALTYVPPK